MHFFLSHKSLFDRTTIILEKRRKINKFNVSSIFYCTVNQYDFFFQVEYEVEACSTTGVTSNGCIDVRKTSLTMPTGGDVIYGVAHQHTGGVGSTLYGEVILI